MNLFSGSSSISLYNLIFLGFLSVITKKDLSFFEPFFKAIWMLSLLSNSIKKSFYISFSLLNYFTDSFEIIDFIDPQSISKLLTVNEVTLLGISFNII